MSAGERHQKSSDRASASSERFDVPTTPDPMAPVLTTAFAESWDQPVRPCPMWPDELAGREPSCDGRPAGKARLP